MGISWNRAGRLFFVVSLLAFAVAILLFREPPILRDYSDWIYQGVLLAKTLTGHPVAGYALKLYPVPNTITTFGLGLLTVAFGWQLAAKLWMVLYLVFAVVTGLYAGAVFRVRDAGFWWVVPATLFTGQLFWFGTVSFNIGLCCVLLLACELYRERERSFVIAGLLVVCFFVHLIVYASAMVMILLYSMQHRRWRLTYVGLWTVPLVVWYVVGRLLSHSNESGHGYAPPSHIAVACVVVLLLLVLNLRRGWSIHRAAGPVLVVLSAGLVAAGLLSGLIPAAHLSARAHTNIFLLQLKAMQPFMLFGFVNVTYTQLEHEVFSASMKLLHREVYLTLMVLDVVAGVLIIVDMARTLLGRRRRVGGPVDEADRPADFLWDFITLYGLLYVVCPPNGLGVITLDMRLAQLALAPALLLLAQREKTALRYASVPCVLLMVSSFVQFSVSQRRFRMEEEPMRLPLILDYFGAVNPIVLADELDVIRSGKMDHFIFDTGIFVETTPHGDGGQEPLAR